MDSETAKLVIQLQLDDIASLEASQRGKYRDGEPPDYNLALESYRAELESSKTCANDRILALSIANAVILDAEAIAAGESEERQAIEDRKLALSLSVRDTSKSSNVTRPATPAAVSDLSDELIEKYEAMHLFYSQQDIDNNAESSSQALLRQKTNPPAKRECVSCGDSFYFFDLAHLTCEHDYCGDCLQSLFRNAITDEAYFPPRCCKQPISLERHRLYLPSTLIGEFRAKKVEYETPNRVYCYQPACSTFVPTEFIRAGVATCVKCHEKTCAICKQCSHDGDCPEDPAIQQVRKVAKENNLQTCYSCNRLIELNQGCNHITCLCKAQFCYICGKAWKTCGCAQWDETRLLSRATGIVERNNGNRFLGQRDRAALVDRVRRNLRENHDCIVHDWSFTTGRHRCEACHDTLPDFIFECDNCHITVCKRCKLNRL